jgi:two-component system, NtrC family, response regulator AtoC
MQNDRPTLLIVDDEKNTREGLRAALEDRYEIYITEDAKAARQMLESESFDVMLTDLRLPGEDGIQLIKRAKALNKPPICLLMTAYGSEEVAAQAIREGADDYISKGRLQIDLLRNRIDRALKQQKLETENRDLKDRLDSRAGLEHITGASPAMVEIFDMVKQVAPSRATILILGENGTGKEMIAKSAHQLSPRAKRPLITVHCAGLAANILESELFGHEKGAFTGAHERRLGRFELANGGTLFLDEIGEIDPATQVKLLRFLGERTFERVGSNKTISVDVRLIAATNKDLMKLVEEGKFREDLYYRLRVVQITMPSLRSRTGDIPLLANRFLKEFAKENGKPIREFTSDAMEALLEHRWPGNVRELRSAIEHAVVLSKGAKISLRDLPLEIRKSTQPVGSVQHGSGSGSGTGSDAGNQGGALPRSQPGLGGGASMAVTGLNLHDAERALIFRALDEVGGNRTLAARRLGISRRTLHRKLRQYQINESYEEN